MSTERRQLIYKAAETLPDGFEFDAKMIEEILFEGFDEVIPIKSISRLLPSMNFNQRELDKQEITIWRSQYDSRPKTVYSRHLGSDRKNYTRGWAKPRPSLPELEERQLDIEECAVCPEWKECKGEINPCPRFPVQALAPRDRVYRLEDFE